MYVSRRPSDTGPPRPSDTVTVGIADGVDFYILVHSLDQGMLNGEIVAIGPDPRENYQSWSHGDKVRVEEAAVRAIIRHD